MLRPISLITGASSGIGAQTARALAAAGHDIIIGYGIHEEAAKELATELVAEHRVEVLRAKFDLSQPELAADQLRTVVREAGGLDVLVNNAGVNRRATAVDEDLKSWQRVLDINLTSPFVLAREAARAMIAQNRGGRIINVTSVHEHIPITGGSIYCAAKSGLGMLTKVMALELAPHGITVNSVAPGETATPMNGVPTGHPAASIARPEIPVGRPGSPGEMASLIAYLTSINAAYLTGASLVVDGGLSLAAAEANAANARRVLSASCFNRILNLPVRRLQVNSFPSPHIIPPVTRIPTARNVDHHAFTVPDLRQGVEFFVDFLGAEHLYTLGPVQDDHDWMARQLGVHPRAVAQIAMLRLGGTNIELFDYQAPDQRTTPPRNCDIGGHHLAIGVTDIEKAVDFLQQQVAVAVQGDIQTISDGPIAGNRWIYFRTPWGLQMELQQVAEYLPYENETGARLYRPASKASHSGRGIPTALGVDHICYTVPDLAQALDFFTHALGGELLYRANLSADARFSERQLSVFQPIKVAAAMVRLGPVTNVELFQYTVAEHRTELPRNSDIGGHHLAFYVDDVAAAAAYLRSVRGVEVLGEPQMTEDGGPIHGNRWVYFRAPWGLQMEVLNMPDGMPYERHTAARRFGPASSWDYC